MTTKKTVEAVSVGAMVAGVLAAVLAYPYPLAVIGIWKITSPTPLNASAQLRAIYAALGPLMTFSNVHVVAQVWGCVVGPVHLFFGLFLWVVLKTRGAGLGRLGRAGLYSSLFGHAVQVYGNLFDYWRLAGTESLLHETSWMITNLGALAALVGWVLLGIAILRTRTYSRRVGLLLLLGSPGPASLYCAWTLAGYYPYAPWVTVSVLMVSYWFVTAAAIFVFGWEQLKEARGETRAHSHLQTVPVRPG